MATKEEEEHKDLDKQCRLGIPSPRRAEGGTGPYYGPGGETGAPALHHLPAYRGYYPPGPPASLPTLPAARHQEPKPRRRARPSVKGRTLGGAAVETPEEIERWIEERRRRYPTAARIDEREHEEVQERPGRDSRGLCKYFRRGSCRNGERCKYSHERGESFTGAKAELTRNLLARLDSELGRVEMLLGVFRFLQRRNYQIEG